MSGPRNAPLPSVPNVPAAGSANAAGLRYSTQFFVFTQAPGPYGLVPPTRTPRSDPRAVPDWSLPAFTVTGPPDCAENSPVSCQPPAIKRNASGEPVSFGLSQTKLVTPRCL